MNDRPTALVAADVPPRTKASNYPEPFASQMSGRIKRPLGDLFSIKSFGVNLTRLIPGARSALHHVHSVQDEFIYVLEGEPTLILDKTETMLRAGVVAGFVANGAAHHLENRTAKDCVFLEVGDRAPGDQVSYPNDDLQAVMIDGTWRALHKDGTAY